VRHLSGFFTGFFIVADTLDLKCLADMGELEIFIEFRSDPDMSSFNATMIAFTIGAKIRFTICGMKEEGNVFEKLLLISFGGEVVLCPSFLNQILG